MADITLTTSATARVVESIEQCTLIAAENISPGQAVRIDPSSGRFTLANATSASEARVYGIACGGHTIPAGYPVTAIRRGVVDAYIFNGSYDAPVYLSNTDGTLADAAGTVNVVIGRVLPAAAASLGAGNSKLLLINL